MSAGQAVEGSVEEVVAGAAVKERAAAQSSNDCFDDQWASGWLGAGQVRHAQGTGGRRAGAGTRGGWRGDRLLRCHSRRGAG